MQRRLVAVDAGTDGSLLNRVISRELSAIALGFVLLGIGKTCQRIASRELGAT